MTSQLEDRRVAFLLANEGVEQVELIAPWEAVERAGGQPVLVAPEPDPSKRSTTSIGPTPSR